MANDLIVQESISASANFLEFRNSESQALLIKSSNGEYSGPLSIKGKQWCDGFIAGVEVMKMGIKP